MKNRWLALLLKSLLVTFVVCAPLALSYAQEEAVEEEEFITDDIEEEIAEGEASDFVEDQAASDSTDDELDGDDGDDAELDGESSDDEFADFKDDELDSPAEKNTDAAASQDTGDDEFADFEEEAIAPAEKPVPAEEPAEKFADDFEPDEVPAAEPTAPPVTEPPVAQPEPEPVSEPYSEPVPQNPAPVVEAPGPQPYQSLGDEPDLQYEAYLHDVYINFHRKGTSNKEWETLISGKDSEVYRIREGDNLWTISETFFGDGNYWPKVWAVNAQFGNPHSIEPGQRVYFVLGDVNDAPYFAVSSVEPSQDIVQVTEDEDIEIPPTLKRSRPVIQTFPPSLPEWQNASRTQDYDDLGISYGEREINKKKNSKYLEYYLTERRPANLGFVAEIEATEKIASNNQYIYVYLDGGKENIGETFVVAQSFKRKVAPALVGRVGGYSIQVQGEIKPVSIVPDKGNSGQTLFRALVVRAINPVTPKSFVLKTKLRRVVIDMQGPRSDLVAEIIGSHNEDSNPIFGKGSYVYLDRGAQDGARVGHIMPIRSKRNSRRKKSVLGGDVRIVGWLKVVHTSSIYSTGVVVNSWEEVFPGDLTGRGAIIQRQGSFSEPTGDEFEELDEFVDKKDDISELDEDFDDNLFDEEAVETAKKSTESNSEEEDLEGLDVEDPDEFDEDFE